MKLWKHVYIYFLNYWQYLLVFSFCIKYRKVNFLLWGVIFMMNIETKLWAKSPSWLTDELNEEKIKGNLKKKKKKSHAYMGNRETHQGMQRRTKPDMKRINTNQGPYQSEPNTHLHKLALCDLSWLLSFQKMCSLDTWGPKGSDF